MTLFRKKDSYSKIKVLLLLCTSLSMCIILCTYSAIHRSELDLHDEHHFTVSFERSFKRTTEEVDEKAAIQRNNRSAKMRHRQFPKVSSNMKRNYDTCRNELTSAMTLSISEFCQADAIRGVDNLPAKFGLIERSISPYMSLFDETRERYQVVIIPNALCHQTDHIDPSEITLTTQMSTNKLKRLVALAGRWNGPVSVAVKVTSIEELRDFQSQLSIYMPQLTQVAFHLYFESKHRAYPNNILRNLALDQVKSDYFAVMDVDLLPSPINTHQHLRSTFAEHPELQDKMNDKTVLIMPAFELVEEVSNEDIAIKHPLYPESREMVIQMNSKRMDQRKIRIFRHVFEPGHRSTNYPKWTSHLKEVSYPIKAQEYGYEPYIIGAMKGAPRFFRDFRGYGFNKLSYYVELHYAEYKMEVLRDFFIFHVNHPTTYGGLKDQHRDVNLVCVRYFLEYLSRNYGAGNLGEENEVAGWDDWLLRLRIGQGTYVWEEQGSEENEEEENGTNVDEEGKQIVERQDETGEVIQTQ